VYKQGGAQGVSASPSQKNCAEKLRYSNRAVTLIKQSHDYEAVHDLLLYMLVSCDFFLFLVLNL